MTDMYQVLRRAVQRGVMTGIARTGPVWESVPTDPCQPTGEMRNVVSTNITPLVDHILDGLAPLIEQLAAAAWEEGHGHCYHVEDPRMTKRNPYTADGRPARKERALPQSIAAPADPLGTVAEPEGA